MFHVASYTVTCNVIASVRAPPADRTETVWTNMPRSKCNLYLFGPLSALPVLTLFGPVQHRRESLHRSVFFVLQAMILSDVLFYIAHRLLHTRYFYRFHAEHHRWTSVEPHTAFDASVIEHCFGNVLPFIVACLLAGLDQIEMLHFITLVTVSSVLAHSCENGPHAVHHRQASVNFGAGLFIMDRVVGTFVTTL